MSPEETIKKTVSFDGPIYALNERSPAGIPAVELDTTTGQRVVLIFSSKESAKKYCYLRKPEAENNIFEFTRKTSEEGTVVQAGLIKVARVIMRDHPEISSFILDHPGTRGAASYLTIEDVAFLGRKKPSEIGEDTFESLLDTALGE